MARIEMSSTQIQRDLTSALSRIEEGDEIVVLRWGRPVALMTAYPQETIVNTTTTDYGTWYNLMGGSTLTITDYVREALDDESDYDVEAIVAEFRNEINAVLPDGITLNGDSDMYGPYPNPDWWMDKDSDEWQELRQEIEAIDLYAIASRHDGDS